MKSRRILLLTVCVLLLLAMVPAYQYWHNRDQRAPFHIAMNEWVGFAPLFLARDLGYFDGLPVDFEFVAVEGDKRAGFYAGRFDMIAETADMFQTNRDSADYPGKIVFAIDESSGGDGVVGSASIRTVKDLVGKSVVAEPGQPAYFILQYLLNKDGMSLKDLNLQDMNSSDAAAAFIAEKADAAGTYEPFLSQALQKRAGAHLLASSKDLPGLIVDVAIVRSETLASRRQDVAAIYSGWCKANDYMKEHPEDATERMAKAFKLSPEEFKDTVSGLRYLDCDDNKRLLGSETSRGQLYQTFDSIGAILKANHLTTAVSPASSRIDPSVEDAVAKAR